eukprot:12398959-Prorocentrum_lima.AAC.1
MTSSLVGSEMCIRDRDAAHDATPTSHVLPPSLATHSADEGGGPKRRPAVSYTHLTLPTICSV